MTEIKLEQIEELKADIAALYTVVLFYPQSIMVTTKHYAFSRNRCRFK